MARKSPNPKPSAPAPRAAVAPEPPAWQSIATALLMLHLFCLALGLIANANSGKSMLVPALRSIPGVRQYLQLLGMDVGYDFYIASPLPEDGVHHLKLVAHPSDTEEATDSIPADADLVDPTMQPGIRRQRYERLAYNVGFFDEAFAENSDYRTQLPLTIAETWLTELDAPHEAYILTCVREPSKRLPKAIERAPGKVREGGPRMSGPSQFAPETVTINLVWDPEEGHYQGSRAEAADQNSQVVPSATPPKPVSEGQGGAVDTVPPAIDPSAALPSNSNGGK